MIQVVLAQDYCREVTGLNAIITRIKRASWVALAYLAYAEGAGISELGGCCFSSEVLEGP